ncbi:unnamed protein product, partial [Ectocarpus sp. 12 AP-2014]
PAEGHASARKDATQRPEMKAKRTRGKSQTEQACHNEWRLVGYDSPGPQATCFVVKEKLSGSMNDLQDQSKIYTKSTEWSGVKGAVGELAVGTTNENKQVSLSTKVYTHCGVVDMGKQVALDKGGVYV